jgi:TrpR family trp operon transcriptional repressor
MSAVKKMPELPAGLLRALARLDKPEEIGLVMGDLLTPSEVEALGERWQIARLLLAGKSQREVAAELGVSVTTVSRGSRQLKYGQGGFQVALEALKKGQKG